MPKLLKFFQTFSIIALVLGGTMTSNAQEQCEIRYWDKSKPFDFNHIKIISFNDSMQAEFHFDLLGLSAQYFSHVSEDVKRSGLLEIDRDLLSDSDGLQDLFWLFALAEYPDTKDLFSSQFSDFAPYIVRALKRQNMDKMAHQLSTAMAAYGTRYQGFDPEEKSIKAFSIPISDQEADNDWGPAHRALLQYKKALAVDMDDTSFEREHKREYEMLYALTPKTLAAQKLMAEFPSQSEIYSAIYARICQNPNLKNWYYQEFNAIPQDQLLSRVALTLSFNRKAFGPYENWPVYYQDIDSLTVFQVGIMDTGIFSYFYSASPEDIDRLLKALKNSNLDDVLQIAKETKAFHEKLQSLNDKFDLSSPNGFEQAEEYLGVSVEQFEAKIDIYDINDKIDRAILKLGLDNKIISY